MTIMILNIFLNKVTYAYLIVLNFQALKPQITLF